MNGQTDKSRQSFIVLPHEMVQAELFEEPD